MTLPDHSQTDWIAGMLWRDELADPDVRPPLKDSIWVANVPCGPINPEGLRRLREIQEHFGSCHVTTGNAVPVNGIKRIVEVPELATGDPIPKPESLVWECGVYVRDSAYEDAPNPLRAYLSEGP